METAAVSRAVAGGWVSSPSGETSSCIDGVSLQGWSLLLEGHFVLCRDPSRSRWLQCLIGVPSFSCHFLTLRILSKLLPLD